MSDLDQGPVGSLRDAQTKISNESKRGVALRDYSFPVGSQNYAVQASLVLGEDEISPQLAAVLGEKERRAIGCYPD